MKRNSFIKRLLTIGTGVVIFRPTSKSMAKQEENQASKEKKHLIGWISTLLEQLKGQPQANISSLLEPCGRQCAKSGAIQMAKECNGNAELFLKNLASIIGEKNVLHNDRIVTIRYDKCYCPIVAENPDTPGTLCECSRGWVLEMFETALKQSVSVKTTGTILRGQTFCEFKIYT